MMTPTMNQKLKNNSYALEALEALEALNTLKAL